MFVSANLRDFHADVGELTHMAVRKYSADIVFVCEMFLDDMVSVNYARVKGYSACLRKDRNTQGEEVTDRQ